MARPMPGKTARALCPVCQEPMPPDETECENCGAFVIDEAVVRLSRAFGIPREKALALFEKGFRHPKQLGDRDVDDVLKKGENGLLFLCTNCGGFVATGDAKCPRCGAEFESEEEPTTAAPEKDILDLALCPICGADNDPSWKECEICGEPLGGTEEPPGAEPVPPSATAEERAATAEATRPPPETLGLDHIDDILKDLDLSANARAPAKVRPIQRIPKATRRTPRVAAPPKPVVPKRVPAARSTAPKPVVKPVPRPRPIPSPRPAVRPARTPPAPPTRKPAPSRPPRPVEAPRRATAVSTRAERPRATPPLAFLGAVMVAAAAALYASQALGGGVFAWGVAGVVLLLASVIFGITLSRHEAHVGRTDALLLAGGAVVSSAAPALHATYAPIASLAGAVLFALATRRLLATGGRDLLVATAGLPLAAFGVVAAQGHSFAASPAWALGLAAAAPWPAVVAIQSLRDRRTSAAAHREIAKAEGDIARRDYAASVKDFDRAIALEAKGRPSEDLPWYGKGASLILLGRYDEALRAIDKALDLNPRNEVAWLNKGNALTKMGRLLDALRCFNAAIQVNPDYEVAWNNKGNTLARLGHLDEALTCYERALEIDPAYRGAWVNKGYVLTKLGRYDEATSCADRVLRLNERPRSRTA